MTVMLEFTNLASLKPFELVQVEGDGEMEDAHLCISFHLDQSSSRLQDKKTGGPAEDQFINL